MAAFLREPCDLHWREKKKGGQLPYEPIKLATHKHGSGKQTGDADVHAVLFSSNCLGPIVFFKKTPMNE
jgi:hypothetical protein